MKTPHAIKALKDNRESGREYTQEQFIRFLLNKGPLSIHDIFHDHTPGNPFSQKSTVTARLSRMEQNGEVVKIYIDELPTLYKLERDPIRQAENRKSYFIRKAQHDTRVFLEKYSGIVFSDNCANRICGELEIFVEKVS